MKTAPFLMKALLCLSSLLCITICTYAQNNYIEANSLAGVEVRQGGGINSICPTYKSEFSTNNPTTQFFFKAIECSASYLKFEIFNNTSGTVKITIRTQNGASVVHSRTLASGSSSGEMLLLTDVTNYSWKFESSNLPMLLVNDAISLDVTSGAIIQPKSNDYAVPANTGYRVKAGQTVTVGTLVQNAPILSELFLSNTSIGSQTITLEAYNLNTNVVLGESLLTITVNTACAFSIGSILQANAQTYNVTVISNRTTKPYFYRIYDNANNIVKTGNTSAANLTNTELIDVGNIPTGVYSLKMYSTSVTGCGEPSKTFSHVNSTDICTMNARAVRSLNNYVITLPTISGVLGYDFVLKTPTDSVITQGVATGISKVFDFTGRYDGVYSVFLKPNNSTKICSQIINLVWQNINSTNLRGYLKKYNNATDFYEIGGVGDYGGVKDAGTGWVLKENKTVVVWQTYVKSLSNTGTKAILTMREDSSSTARHISLAVLNDKLQVIQRTVKGGQNAVVIEAPSVNAPIWVRIERSGNVAVLKYSLSSPESDNQIWVTVNTFPTAFLGWKPIFYKGLYTSSNNINTLSSAEFHRFLGGLYTGTIPDNTPNNAPVITASNLNPTANSSVILSASACKSGFLIQYYKNGLPSYQGGNYTVSVAYGDNYKAKCEKGADKSAFSNTITFVQPSPGNICNITDGLLLGVKSRGSNYNMYARIFAGKLWLTQSLGTTPESFLVRGVNLLSNDFNNTSNVTDFSCFEGQNTDFGGYQEPANFNVPSGYTLTVTNDGAKIYTLGVGSGVSPPTLVSSPEVPTTSTSATFSVSNCAGTVSFFKNNLIISGVTNPLTVALPIGNDIYSAKCTVGSSTSGFSNTITITSPIPDNTNEVSMVLHQGGKKIYNGNGTVNYIPINPVISNNYFFSETVNRSCQSGTLMYAFDDGDYNGTHLRGWKNYPVTNIDLSAMQGKTLLFMSACVGANYNDVFDPHSTFIYLKKNLNAPSQNTSQLTYAQYPTNYKPNFGSNLPQFATGVIPSFSIPQKFNVYEGVMPTNALNFDMCNLGMVAWHLKKGAIQTFPASVNYITDPDVWTNNTFRPASSNPSANNATTSFMQQKADVFSGYGNLKLLISDDEWRFGQAYDNQGLTNMYSFYQKTKSNLPNTLLSAHHNQPYKFNWNTQSINDDKNCFNGFFSSERQLHTALGGGLLGQYWDDIAGKTSGDNTGNTLFGAISMDGYVHFHNPTNEIYRFAQDALVNKKYYPTKKVLTTIEGWNELLSADYGPNVNEKFSWKPTPNTGEVLNNFIPLSASHMESVALVSNVSGDGVNFWGNFLTVQESRPDAYYAINSLTGVPEGSTNPAVTNDIGYYQSDWKGDVDYLFLGLQKFSTISSSYDFNTPIMYEISTDGGTTWIANFDNAPGPLGRTKKPMAIGVKTASGRHAIVAVYPFNSPILNYTFKIRTAGMPAIDVTVSGHFPSLIFNNNSF